MANMQGGEFEMGFALSAGSAAAMKGWQAMRDWTDKSAAEADPDFYKNRRVHPIDGEYDTIGTRGCTGDCREFRMLKFLKENYEGTYKRFNTSSGRFTNLVSKVHDFMNGWNYKQGVFVGRGPLFNAVFDLAYSYPGMPIAGIYTGFAFSSTTYQPIVYRHKY
jgi:hypothetical protein